MKQLLEAGFAALHLPEDGIPSLLRYAELLEETNKVMNLTAIKDPEGVARLHFLDSLSLLHLIELHEKTVVDVGTGAGFPGLPLRIVDPSIQLTLLDSLGKRITFLQQVCDCLGFSDVTCIHARAEEFAPQKRETYDIALSRAVAPLNLLAELCLPLVKPGGTFAAMKSVDSGEELAAAEHAIEMLGGRLSSVQDYTIPGTTITHRLVLVEKIAATPANYPRAFAKIKKAPL